MKRNRGGLVQDLEAQQWSCWTQDDGRILAHHTTIAGSDNNVPLPLTTPTILSDMLALVRDDPDASVELFITSPSQCAAKLGIDEQEYAERYGYGDSGMTYSLLLYAVISGVDE